VPLGKHIREQAVVKLWRNEPVMTDFVTYAAGPLPVLACAHGAKGVIVPSTAVRWGSLYELAEMDYMAEASVVSLDSVDERATKCC
jgi:hypothetical protein